MSSHSCSHLHGHVLQRVMWQVRHATAVRLLPVLGPQLGVPEEGHHGGNHQLWRWHHQPSGQTSPLWFLWCASPHHQSTNEWFENLRLNKYHNSADVIATEQIAANRRKVSRAKLLMTTRSFVSRARPLLTYLHSAPVSEDNHGLVTGLGFIRRPRRTAPPAPE